MEKQKILKSNVLKLWAPQYSEVTRWLTKLQRKNQAAYHLYRFCEWAHKTPPELLTLKEKDATISPPPNTVEKLLDEFCGQLSGDFKNAERYNVAIAVKSFFKWNYRDLAKASGIVSLEKVKPYNALSKESLRKIYNRALNPRERAILPFVTSTGIAKETLANLTWGHLEPDWERAEIPCISIGSELLKGHGKGKYAGVKQITFLTPEAKRELINYRDWIQEKLGRKLQPSDHIWLEISQPYSPLGYDTLGQRILTLTKSASVNFSLHDGRRWLTTALEQVGLSPNWNRVLRGRKVTGSENPYSRPVIEQLRAKFKEAVPLLEFTTETQTASKELEDRVKALEAFKATLTPDQRELMAKTGIKLRKKSTIDKAAKEMCKDGEHCGEEDFKQINESELLQYLREGWQIAYKLDGGQVIIKAPDT